MKRLVGLLIVVMAGLALTSFSGRALAAATECNTGPPGNAPLSGTIVGGLVVNAGDICVLGAANISGGVRVNKGGVLFVCASTISGGFIADGAATLILGAEEIDCAGDVINGAIQISNTGPGAPGGPPTVAIERSTINGGVRLSGNLGMIAVASNRIAGALVCSNNAFNLEDEGLPNLFTGAVRCKFGD